MLKLKKDQTTGIWYITGTLARGRIRESTKTRDRNAAKLILQKRDAEELERYLLGEQQTTIFAEAVEYYLQKGGEATYIRPLLDRFGLMRLNDITDMDVATAASELKPGCKASTLVRHVYGPMSAIYRAAAKAGMCHHRVFDKPRVKRQPIQYANMDQLCRLLDTLNDQMRAIVLFMSTTGARVTNSVELKWRDVDFNDQSAIIQDDKRNRSHRVKLPSITFDAMMSLENRDPDQRVFGFSCRHSVTSGLNRGCRRAGIPFLSPHKIGRHTFSAIFLSKGFNLKMLQEAGGWSNIRVVADTYGHLERSDVDAAMMEIGKILAKKTKKYRKLLINNNK